MVELPSGTVTFLFTDLEGSTRLLKELRRDCYDELLREHQRLLRAAFDAHDGRIVDTQGDSFFVAFRTAADAVGAAVDAQRDLAAATWPAEATVKVRMGLHTGEPKVGDDRYVGIGVHRAARIGACGHGGQVLLSATTKELAEEELPPGVTIRDLGVRRLKDIDQPQHVYQLDVVGLQSKFADLKTLDAELRRKKRRMYAGSALMGVIAAAVAIPVFAFAEGGSSGGEVTDGNAVAVIDPDSNRVTQDIPVGARPGSITAGSGSIWAANLDDQSVSRIDPDAETVTRNISTTDTPTGLAGSRDHIWVAGSVPGTTAVSVSRIDPEFDTITRTALVDDAVPGGTGSAAALGDAVWIAPGAGLLTRINPDTGRGAESIDPNGGATAVAVGADATWVADSEANTVTRIDSTGLLDPIPVGNGPSAIAVGAGGVWVANQLDDAVVRIDPQTRAPTTTIQVGQRPNSVTVGAGSIWVANGGDGTVTRIDPEGRSTPVTIRVGGSPQGIVFADGRVWVTVARRLTGSPATTGGTLRLSWRIDFMDSALAWEPQSWQLLAATCAKLLNYPDKPAPAGSQLAPEVAQSLPTRSRDGKTYTFTIRRGFRFSPPSNAPVTAAAFRETIERALDPGLKGPAQAYFGDIVGAEAYMAGKAPHISGIVVRGTTLAVHLTAPAGDLPARLAMPFFCAVPPGTPRDAKGVRVIPSAGPYYVASYTPGQGVVLRRNPNYNGSRPHHFDRIELVERTSDKQEVRDVEAGTTDYAIIGTDASETARLERRYGAASTAARRGQQQYFVNPSLSIDFVLFNTHSPVFRDPRLRRAANYAVDRTALSRAGGLGSPAERPTDQYLPPGMPGFRNETVYPFKPDLTTARRLVGDQRRTVVLYTCNRAVCDRRAQILKTNLAAIGIDVTTRTVASEALSSSTLATDKRWDLALAFTWAADYPDPGDFLTYLLASGAQFSPPFDDPAFQNRSSAAAALSGPRRYLAYGKLDVETARDKAPWIAVGNAISQDFFSKRVGCQVYQPVYGMDLAALCLRH